MNCRDAKTRRNQLRYPKVSPGLCPSICGKGVLFPYAQVCFLLALLLSVSAANLSCGSKQADLRSLAPAETLVYLETDDLAAALQPIVDSKPFAEVAKSKPDFSALKGVQVAVAVTGFETTEEKLTDEHSVGKVQPRFVAIADTHAWNFQAVAFADQKLGEFVTDIYKSDTTEEQTDKHGGKFFSWTARDGRKAFALVIDSQIYFGNDETAIEKCLAVRRGESDSLAKTGKLAPRLPDSLASGYVSTDGVAQIAALVGLQFASEASDDADVQSTVAGILPSILRSSITEIVWTSTKTDRGIEDKYAIAMATELAAIFNETMAASESPDDSVNTLLPLSLESVSIYKFKNPQLALRSLLLTAGERAEPFIGKIFAQFIAVTFDSYGIRDAEKFLGSLGSVIAIARLDSEDRSAIIASVKDQKTAELSLSENAKPLVAASANGRGRVWQEDDQAMKVIFENNRILIGDERVVDVCGVTARDVDQNLPTELFRANGASIVSVGKDTGSALSLIAMLAREGHGDTQAVSTYTTETRFTRTGIERRTVSDFGLIGSIIAQLAAD